MHCTASAKFLLRGTEFDMLQAVIGSQRIPVASTKKRCKLGPGATRGDKQSECYSRLMARDGRRLGRHLKAAAREPKHQAEETECGVAKEEFAFYMYRSLKDYSDCTPEHMEPWNPWCNIDSKVRQMSNPITGLGVSLFMWDLKHSVDLPQFYSSNSTGYSCDFLSDSVPVKKKLFT